MGQQARNLAIEQRLKMRARRAATGTYRAVSHVDRWSFGR
jgi:hypothetical protein